MADYPPNTRFVVREPAITWDEIGGEIVAINLESGHYFSLRHTARDLFVMLANDVTLANSVAQLPLNERDADTVAREANQFVTELVDCGLLAPALVASEPSRRSGEGTFIERDPPHLPLSEYSTPRLETYTDLEDLMLLDPVHDVDSQGWPRAVTDA